MAFTTVYTVTYPSEAHIIKMQLEAEGLDVFIKDELMAQVGGVSQDLGGVKVQVLEKDYQAAGSILIRLGYIDMDSRNDGFFGSIDIMTKKIPIVRHWDKTTRLIFFVVATISVFFLAIISMYDFK